jgi:hypothetical protein
MFRQNLVDRPQDQKARAEIVAWSVFLQTCGDPPSVGAK